MSLIGSIGATPQRFEKYAMVHNIGGEILIITFVQNPNQPIATDRIPIYHLSYIISYSQRPWKA